LPFPPWLLPVALLVPLGPEPAVPEAPGRVGKGFVPEAVAVRPPEPPLADTATPTPTTPTVPTTATTARACWRRGKRDNHGRIIGQSFTDDPEDP
jgi:hypothetical protein